MFYSNFSELSYSYLIFQQLFFFQGTPFTCKAYDGKLVTVTGGASARVGVPVQLAVDAAQAGEGNLEITVAAHGLNIPTQVHPQVIKMP